ncbi:hypothetical protein OF829_00880 [Sphingomonas sp. LB-2]|uniref:hypothetical protein n=1 Tax=Sphingomonas caeni TaxID=2984949 RepID=UPI00222F9657|nr:hypothetical protein [Sphingomonas caeni]MCW3845775.1 hypothetical protein [Sphingomonas caeni]
MKRVAPLVLVLLLLPLPAAAQRDTVNKEQFRHQNPRKTQAQLQDQFVGLFEPVDLRRRKDAPEPRNPLTRVMLTGKPYAATVPGLCRSDSVVMRFAPIGVGSGPFDATTPVRAYGLETSASFYFVRPPTGWYRDMSSDGRSPWDHECHGVGWPETGGFVAKEDEQATDAYWAVHLAGEAVAAGKVVPVCEEFAEKRDCREVVATFAASPFWFVDACDAAWDRRCFAVLGADDVQMRVVARLDGMVERVEMSQVLLLSHAVLD